MGKSIDFRARVGQQLPPLPAMANHRIRRELFAILIAAIATACGPATEVRALSESLATVEREIASLREELTTHQDWLGSLNNSVANLEARFHDTAELNVTSPGYSFLDSEAGRFVISVANVQPYANGQRITLVIGNPQYVSFQGFTLKMQWGTAPPSGRVERVKWRPTLRDGEFKMSDQLRSGTWNRVQVTLAPASAEEIGYVAVTGLETDSLSLLGVR